VLNDLNDNRYKHLLSEEASRYVYDTHVLTTVKMNCKFFERKLSNLSNLYCAYPLQDHTQCMTKSSCHQAICIPPNARVNSILQNGI
jgi:hypothetical protein